MVRGPKSAQGELADRIGETTYSPGVKGCSLGTPRMKKMYSPSIGKVKSAQTSKKFAAPGSNSVWPKSIK